MAIQPSFVVDISEEMDKKMLAVSAYKSQFDDNPNNVGLLEGIKTHNAFWGRQVRVTYGEPFCCREIVKIASPLQVLEL